MSHELAHWRRRDHLTGLLAECVVCLLPWHPLLWLAKAYLTRLSEQACDDWVVASGQPCEEYAESLVHFRPGQHLAIAPGVVGSKRGLAARIRRILQDNCADPRLGVRWALVVLLLVVCVGTGVAFAQTRAAKEKTETQVQPAPTQSMHAAAAAGDIELVKSLISQGADVNAKAEHDRGFTPLYYAVQNGHKRIMEVLLAHGADTNIGDKYGYTPLYPAI